MTNATEDNLRAAVHQLADEARSVPGLAERALRGGRRVRRRRRATASAGAILAAVALATPFLLARPQPTTQVAEPAPPGTATRSAPVSVEPKSGGNWTSTPLVLPGEWVVTGAIGITDPTSWAWVLDRETGRYRTVSGYAQVWTAPRGHVAAVLSFERPSETGLLDLRTGAVRWIRTGRQIMQPQWSPDGSRLVLTIDDKDAGSTAIGVLTATGRFRAFPVDTEKFFCTDYCFFTWGPDGREVAFQQTDSALPRSESARHPRRGVQFFSAEDGRPTRFLAVRGDPAGPWSWSPDGQRVVLTGPDGPQLVEVATGGVLRPMPDADAVWVDDGRLLYRSHDESAPMVLIDDEGRELERQALPPGLIDQHVSMAPK
ncbi:hypothetical protein GA0074696_0621 [Micromonospora purpureochromogenes]|uniref:WD40-like Beta Propeller Repeat n=1 Tax=Micromonospora purpureochromogenes TaxID=47872 RepID=A0A1C4UTZ4_9ACTN|nr:hypothetical protein [Micromonospora purpureochromogenes]SCE75075.1 hypothetical protein GA0074696_0621 [Micromonospora purpureochromogenes]